MDRDVEGDGLNAKVGHGRRAPAGSRYALHFGVAPASRLRRVLGRALIWAQRRRFQLT